MTRSDLFKMAHKITKEDMKLYSNINYRVQFGLNLSSLYGKAIMDKKTFEFKFDFTNDRRKGIPYVAKLSISSENKVEREFFDLERQYGKKDVTVYGQFEAQQGDIIEQREGGSWKNDYRYWYLVTPEGKLEKVADIDSSTRKKLVTKYLKKEVKAEELLGSWY